MADNVQTLVEMACENSGSESTTRPGTSRKIEWLVEPSGHRVLRWHVLGVKRRTWKECTVLLGINNNKGSSHSQDSHNHEALSASARRYTRVTVLQL